MTTPGALFEVMEAYRGGVDGRIGYTSEGLITNIVRNKRNPDWVSDYPVGDVSYPQILHSQIQITGSTGAVNTGTVAAHTHANSFTSFASAAYWTVGQNASLGVYVRATDTYQVDRFSFFAYISSGGALAGGTVDFEIFRENADGSLSFITSDTTVGAFLSPTTGTRMNVSLGDTMTVREGERYMLRLVNRASPARTIAMLGLGGSVSAAALTGALPFSTTGTTDTNKTSYTSGQAATHNAATQVISFFAMARVNVPDEDRTYRDNFDRVNLGPAWAVNQVATSGEMGITNGRMAYSNTTDGLQAAMLIYPTVSDSQRVDVDVHDIASITAGVSIILHWQRENGSGCTINIFSNGTTIASYVSGTLTQRAVVTLDNTDPATWSAYYDVPSKTYTVLKNGQDLGLSWNDSGNVIPHGANQRYAGIEIGRAAGVNGGTVDNFVLRDWTA